MSITNWNELINIPTYVNEISGCNACYEISSLQTDVTDLQTNKVSVNTFNKHHHDCRYFTKNQLKYPKMGGEVNWYNITTVSPAMSAVYDSEVTPAILDALTTPINQTVAPPSALNQYVTIDYLNAAISASEKLIQQIDVFDITQVESIAKENFSTRLSSNIYDTYYSNLGSLLTLDWSPVAHHLEYLVHRRNPYITPTSSTEPETEVCWVDEDVDGNKVWIGERHIFTGGKDGVAFQSGSFPNNRATSPDLQVVGLPNIDDLYNNVADGANSIREKEFANRQVIVYGGVEIGRNLTLLSPISGSQFISASGADAFFNNTFINGDMTYGGSITQRNGKFSVDSTNGSIYSTGSLLIRSELEMLDGSGIDTIFKVDENGIVGTQTRVKFTNFDFNNNNLSIGGILSGSQLMSNTLVVKAGLPSVNLAGYSAVFGDSVLISGGLTIEDFFEIKNDLIIYGDTLLENNVNVCTRANSKFVVGQTDSTTRAGDTYFINWTDVNTKVSTFRAYVREMGTSANLFTLRMSESNILGSGNDVGPNTPLYKNTTNYINDYANWNGVDIRTVAAPYDVYKNNATWTGLEVKTFLSQEDAKYKDSQYLLWTSNTKAFAKSTFPGSNAGDNEFPNTSDRFGWIMSDWFRTGAEASGGVSLPLHLIASKDYVDYRFEQLSVPGSAFKLSPSNLSNDISPEVNDVITWDGSNWVADKIDVSSQLWAILPISAAGDVTLPPISSNTIIIVTDDELSAKFTIKLPTQTLGDVGRLVTIKLVDIPADYFPVRINPYGTDTIDGDPSYFITVQKTSLQLVLAQAGKWFVI